MGVIDQEVLLLKCSCGAEKQVKVLDKGSGYAPEPFYWVLHNFEPEFKARFLESRTQMDPPRIEVQCLDCGKEPIVKRL